MAYLGNTPASRFTSMDKQTITGDGGTDYTLDHAVGSEQEIEVFVNNVRQEPSVAYTVAGTALTMTGNVASTDDFYVVFQGKAQQSVTHPSNSALQATTGTFSGALSAASATVTGDLIVDTDTLYVDSTNNRVGVGKSSPEANMHISAGDASIAPSSLANTLFIENSGDSGITIASGTASQGAIRFADSGGNGRGSIRYDHSGDYMRVDVNGSEKMRIDSSGNLLVGKTSAATNVEGGELRGSGQVIAVATDVNPFLGARLGSDGDIAVFRKDTSTVGNIGAVAGDIYINTGNTGLRFYDATSQVIPVTSGGANRDNAIDLGNSAVRFDDVFATNGTIQTSDANEKQQIASLTDAEITAAKAISKLFKTFKWNSSVTENGDNARTHTGVIAQQVETAMTDAGLDAGDYAFFISTDWYVDADGNEVEADAEGAIAKNRKGIRYPELLSFVGAATEQRLVDIETRLDALENA